MVYPEKKPSLFWRNVFEITGLLLLVFLIRTIGFGLYQVPSGSMETTMLVGERFFADKLTYLFRDPRRGEVIAFNEPPTHYPYAKNPLVNLWQHYVGIIPFVTWGPSNWTKRVIGIPGDTVRGVIEDGKPVIYLNGKKLDEPYLNKYPLISVEKEDWSLIKAIKNKITSWFVSGVPPYRSQTYLGDKSYDPNLPFDKQPFYRIDPKRVIRAADGNYKLKWPATPVKDEEYIDPWSLRKTVRNRDEFYVALGPDEYWLMGDNRRGSQDSRFFGPVKRNYIHGKIIFLIWSHDSDESWWIVDLIKHPIDFWKRMRWNRFFKWIY